MPITLPVALAGPITFDNAVSNFAQIPQEAHKKVQSAIQSGSDANVPLTLAIGPNSEGPTTKSLITSSIQREIKVLSGFQTPPEFVAIAYTAADEKWAEDEWVKKATALGVSQGEIDGRKNQVQNGCEMKNGVAVACSGGLSFFVSNLKTAFVFYGMESIAFWSINPPDYQTSTQITHEFTHAMQVSQFMGNPVPQGDNVISSTARRSYPCWFGEGQAQALGFAIYIQDFQKYLDIRDRTVTRPGPLSPNATLPISDYSAASLTNFLLNQEPYMGNSNPGCAVPGSGTYSLGYNVGLAVVEALVAIGGPQATVALLTQASNANGGTFAAAFEDVYGLSWQKGATILGQVVAAEYAVKPMQNR
jgi:hypothetical protein